MRKFLMVAAGTVALVLVPASALVAQSDADMQAVEAAVLDYVEGVYEVSPERIERSVHPDLTKLGFWRQDAMSEYREVPMNFEQLVELAAGWNANGRIDPKTAPKEIVVFDVLDKTAVAKLTAAWGVDYFQLAKFDGTWKIVNVLWQSTN